MTEILQEVIKPENRHVQHVKSGRYYLVISSAVYLEKDLTVMVAYKSLHTGQLFVRPLSEFQDGRFKTLDLFEEGFRTAKEVDEGRLNNAVPFEDNVRFISGVNAYHKGTTMTEMHNEIFFMFDCETTGLDPDLHRITSICMLPFVMSDGKITKLSPYFHRGVVMSEHLMAHADADTLRFRRDNNVDQMEFENCQVMYGRQYELFQNAEQFVRAWGAETVTFVAKPIIFDWPFWTKGLERAQVKNPFFRRNVLDCHSIAWAAGVDFHEALMLQLDREYYQKHCAKGDCDLQLDTLITILNNA